MNLNDTFPPKPHTSNTIDIWIWFSKISSSIFSRLFYAINFKSIFYSVGIVEVVNLKKVRVLFRNDLKTFTHSLRHKV